MKHDEVLIEVGDFSKTPYGRYPDDGDANGSKFREILEVKLRDPNISKIYVSLDSVEDGYEYGSSFLEEAFGGLVRVSKINKDQIFSKLVIVTENDDYKDEIISYIVDAK